MTRSKMRMCVSALLNIAPKHDTGPWLNGHHWSVWKSREVVYCLSTSSCPHKHTHTVNIGACVLISQHKPAQFSFSGKSQISNAHSVVSHHEHVHIRAGARNKMITHWLFCRSPSLCVSACFSRYKEIAGSLENAISDGLEAAPGRNLFSDRNTSLYLILYLQ